MKNQTVRDAIRFLAPRILAAVLAAFWAVDPAVADQVAFSRKSDTVVEISGGSGKEAWRLRYGAQKDNFKALFVPAVGNRAWYSYGGWLRLIDTEKGLVIGRWHFPDRIVGLVPHDTKVEVEVGDQDGAWHYSRKFELDPNDPHVPYWPTDFLVSYRIPLNEVQPIWPAVFQAGHPEIGELTPEASKMILPELEEAVKRDPLSPWLRYGLGRVLRGMGDPRGTEIIEEAIKTPTTDFTELWPTAASLDSLGEHDLAREAFERGYQDYWQRGNDPRLFTVLIARLVILQMGRVDWGNSPTAHGREMIDRIYRVSPYGEGASYAWQLYGDYLAAHGSADEARLWRVRAKDALQYGWITFSVDKSSDAFVLLAIGSALGAILYAFVLFVRYRPQRRLDDSARTRTARFTRDFAFFNTEYWSRRERIAFFTIILLGWFSVGLAGEYLTAILRRAAMPVSVGIGSLGGPLNIAKLEAGLPATPQRDLLLAVAYQQDGQVGWAEHLYRNLPQFAESWNNLGVILKQKGSSQEARTAFEKALQLNPKLAEAALNLGRPPSDFWTEQHQKYLPGQPMIAPPRDATAAFLGRSPTAMFLRALAGPFSEGNLTTTIELIRKFVG